MIRFRCACGKSLKAPQKLAGKTSRCPACAAAVAVPRRSPMPGDRELPDVRPPVATCAAPGPSTWVPCPQQEDDPNYVPANLRMRYALGTLYDPLAGVKFFFYLSGMLTLLTALGVALYPHVLHEGVYWASGLVLAVVWAGAMAVLLGYGCTYLDSILEYAVSGGQRRIDVPGLDTGPAITSFLRWGLGFACGPAVLICLAFRYWIHCGDVAVVDGLILVELTAPAIGYWIMALLVLAERLDLALASPMRVLQAMSRLGHRSPLAVIGVTAAAFVYVWVGAYAVILLHNGLAGLLLLWLCWYSAWECGAFALRIVGFWYYESSTRTSSPSTLTA